MHFRIQASCLLLAVSFVFCAAPAIAGDDAPKVAENAQNPPPSVALSSYRHFDIAPIKMGAPFAGQKGNEVAKEKLQANLDERIGPLLKTWNAEGAEGGKTLKIQPEIRYIRFITGGKRFWGGGFAGDSSIMVQLRLTDAATGAIVGEPDFYQHANAIGAAWSFGATDKAMLVRISSMAEAYLRDNYERPVGGSISQAPGE